MCASEQDLCKNYLCAKIPLYSKPITHNTDSTYRNHNITDVPQWRLKIHYNADVWQIGISSTIYGGQEPKWGTVGVIERVWVCDDGLVNPLTTSLRLRIVLHLCVDTACIVAHTLCTALPKPARCMYICVGYKLHMHH